MIDSVDLGQLSVPTQGQYVELGFDSITTPAGSFDCYVLTNDYTQKWSEADLAGMGSMEDINAFAEYYYAEGIGLVYELTLDKGTGATVMEKTLANYSGLTPR